MIHDVVNGKKKIYMNSEYEYIPVGKNKMNYIELYSPRC